MLLTSKKKHSPAIAADYNSINSFLITYIILNKFSLFQFVRFLPILSSLNLDKLDALRDPTAYSTFVL